MTEISEITHITNIQIARHGCIQSCDRKVLKISEFSDFTKMEISTVPKSQQKHRENRKNHKSNPVAVKPSRSSCGEENAYED